MVKVKFIKGAFIKGIQYYAGEIGLISEGDALHLYGIGNAEPYSSNIAMDNFGLPKENNYLNVHGKNI